jgi:hypothetical protein
MQPSVIIRYSPAHPTKAEEEYEIVGDERGNARERAAAVHPDAAIVRVRAGAALFLPGTEPPGTWDDDAQEIPAASAAEEPADAPLTGHTEEDHAANAAPVEGTPWPDS